MVGWRRRGLRLVVGMVAVGMRCLVSSWSDSGVRLKALRSGLGSREFVASGGVKCFVGLGGLKERTYTRLVERHVRHLDIPVGHVERRCRCRRGSCWDCAGGDIDIDVHTAVWQVRWLHWCAIGGCWKLFRHYKQVVARQLPGISFPGGFVLRNGEAMYQGSLDF